MAMRNLPQWLVSNSGFNKRFNELTVDSVRRQFFALQADSLKSGLDDQKIGYLLTCASVLAHAESGQCQDAALRIAQYCLISSNTSAQRKDAAALILDALVNHPTIRLAEARGLLRTGYAERLPLVAQLEATKRRILYTIELADHTKILANKFQSEFWNQANLTAWLSVSAPTSVGKSFILETWIQEFFGTSGKNLVIYLVPTRALISEVEADLKSKFKTMTNVSVGSLPLRRLYDSSKLNVFVFTQERFHIFLHSFEQPPKVDLLIVDEAHKIGDRHRGVFLQQVIELTADTNADIKVIFASPFTSNPEVLLEDAPINRSATIKSSDVTVNQNLLWVTQKPRLPKEWELSLCLRDEVVKLGDFTLPNSPSATSKRLTFVALALSQGMPGNIVYVNGAADAEKAAHQLYDSLSNSATIDPEIGALIELCEKTIHRKFLLNTTLKRGVAFHYGNMPLLVKSEIERLFSENKITFLVCTSTLVEGVNMACKNIFVRGPKKGVSTLMNPEDFWNLAGRAGRWGKEFQGNIVCVDTNHAALWKDGTPPRNKAGVKISRTTDSILNDPTALIEYIESDQHLSLSGRFPQLEHVFSYLVINFVRYGSLQESRFLNRQRAGSLNRLNEVIERIVEELTFPTSLIERNPGISPLLMQSLLLRFSRDPDKPVERLLLSEPSSDDALETFVSAFGRISAHLSVALGYSSRAAYVRALLVVRWMRGFPLARLITDRINYLKTKESQASDATVIREVMKDVEEIARYQAPRLLTCYNDLLSYHLGSIARPDLQEEIRDLSLYLELGLNQQTQISLVGIGLSRTAAVLLSERIVVDNLSERDCARWLLENNWEDADFPALVKAEVQAALKAYVGSNPTVADTP